MPPVQRQSIVYVVCWQYITPGKRGNSEVRKNAKMGSLMIYSTIFVISKRTLEKQVSFAVQHTARWSASRCSSASTIISGRTTCSAKWTTAKVASDPGECHKCSGGDRIDRTCFFHWPATISTASRSYVSPYICHCGSHNHSKAGVYSNNSLSSCCMSIQAGRWNSRRPDG